MLVFYDLHSVGEQLMSSMEKYSSSLNLHRLVEERAIYFGRDIIEISNRPREDLTLVGSGRLREGPMGSQVRR